jgi:hypothetical protein
MQLSYECGEKRQKTKKAQPGSLGASRIALEQISIIV